MPGTRVRRYVALVFSMVATFGCGDYSQPTSPPPAARKLVPTFVLTSPFSLVPRGSMAQAVRWGPNHQAVDQRVSAVIGAGGGTLSLPGADFSMTIPAGALTEPTSITVVARGGAHVVYDMFPHGLRFLQPVTAVQGLSTTAIYRTPNANSIRTAYLPDGHEQIRRDDFASPSEVQRAKIYFYGDQAVAETQEWILNHFSRYILISGVWTEVKDEDPTTGGDNGEQSIGTGFPIGILLPEAIGVDLPDK